jgi:23S rRNA (guanosine2251-2'-O)-methyltransferase
MTLLCGINPVLEALNAGTRHFERLLIVKGLRNARADEIVSRATQSGIPLRFEPRETLDRLAGGLRHQGIIAVVSARPLLTLESLLADARDPAAVLLLDGVEDPRNLGAILRTAEAAGVDGVLLPERHSAPLSETVGRSSAGALEHVRIARIGNAAQTLDGLKGRGYWVIGFDALGPERWDAVDYRRPVVLVLGGEGRGMRRLVRERCDQVVSIPLFGHVGSLNVSVAAGIALYELIRQRGLLPSHVRPIAARPAPPPPTLEGSPETGHEAEVGGHPEEPEDWPPKPLILLNDEDEVAWAAPTVLARPRTGFAGRRRRGRPPGTQRHSRPAPPPPTSPADTAQGASPPGPGKLKRRRRRHRGERREAMPGAPQTPPNPPAAGQPAAGGAPKPPRRRRRRRP